MTSELGEASAGPSSSSVNKVPQNGNNDTRRSRNIDKGPPTSASIRRRLTHISAGQPVLLRLPSGKLKSIELSSGRIVSLGKFGSFKADDLLGLPYGFTYEIVPDNDKIKVEAAAVLPLLNGSGTDNSKGKNKGHRNAEQIPGNLRVVINQTQTELEETNATNENINDDTESQTLTFLDIKALKEAGLQGHEIVQKEVESNTSFAQRTAWSQQKFVMRKESKHLQLFTPIPPSITNMFDFFNEKFERDQDKLRGLRSDSIANMLSLAGIAAGGRYILIDGVGGAVAGAILERMGGEGRLIALNDADSPPAFDLLPQSGLSASVVQPVLRTMHWACTDKVWQPLLDLNISDEITPTGKPANDRDKQRFRKQRAQYNELQSLRNEFFEGDFDGLIIASPYECVSVIDKLLPYLAGSSHIVVHHPFLQPMVEAQAQLRIYHSLIDVSVSEPFMRKYQVLPGRMHPEVSTSATAGYILHAIRVLTDEETKAIIVKERARQATEDKEVLEPDAKRAKVEDTQSDQAFQNGSIKQEAKI